jgi:hypothetical protein
MNYVHLTKETCVPGAIIYHLFNKKRKYIILSFTQDILFHEYYNVTTYSLPYNVFDKFTMKDFTIWTLIS